MQKELQEDSLHKTEISHFISASGEIQTEADAKKGGSSLICNAPKEGVHLAQGLSLLITNTSGVERIPLQG